MNNDKWKQTMRIETERLIITEMTMDMAPDVHENSLDEDTRRFVPDEVFETLGSKLWKMHKKQLIS